MFTRRTFLKSAGAAGAGLWLANAIGPKRRAFAQIPGGLLDPRSIAKYVQPLAIPPAMPLAGKIKVKGGKNIDYYEIAVRQFQQQILPPDLPPTTVWSYGSFLHPTSFFYPAFTIEAKWRTPVRVRWINDLVDASGNYLPHLLPVDPTLHWANPAGGIGGRDMRPEFEDTPWPYTGPVPLVTHVHGAHTYQESDGYAEAWFLPAAANIPGGFATTGTFYDHFQMSSPLGELWKPGTAVYEYPNDQRATTLWYHDHTLGMTRLNVYAGPAGFYLLRGGPDDEVAGKLPGPAPARGDAASVRYYEIPIAIQDRSFNLDGSLFYPDSREFFDGFPGPYIPQSDIAPIWNPEFFGNTMVVNGRTWPYLEVERRRYRFRFLNGCNSRFLLLMFDTPLIFHQIGAEGGFLPAPVELHTLLMAPAERADVVVDFSRLSVGTKIRLLNLGPDEPFGGGVPGVDFPMADPNTTGQVMEFRVVARRGGDRSTPANDLGLPPITALGPADNVREVSLNEEDSAGLEDVGPRAALLGTMDSDGTPIPLEWESDVTENPALGSTEIWDILNFTADAHPIHVHLVQFEVLGRAPFGYALGPPETWETGFKDTVIAYPGEVTRIKARFDLAGLYVWHCHIVEHEDHEMMRPYTVG